MSPQQEIDRIRVQVANQASRLRRLRLAVGGETARELGVALADLTSAARRLAATGSAARR